MRRTTTLAWQITTLEKGQRDADHYALRPSQQQGTFIVHFPLPTWECVEIVG